MNRQRFALYFGIALACLGCVIAFRSLMRNRVRTAAAVPVEVPESVRLALGSATIDTVPTPENIEELAAELHRRVLDRVRQIPALASMSESAQDDLATAFVERWRALIDPDMERDHQTLAARGDPRSLSAEAEYFEKYRGWMESLSMSPVGLDGVAVSDGAGPGAATGAAAEDGGIPGFEGFGRGLNGRTEDKMPVPECPVEAGWRSVQIVMPFTKQPMRGEGFGVVLLGFQFAWSAERDQWVPYVAVMYTAPGEIHAAVPFR